MDPLLLTLTILAALLVGAAIPALLQLRRTLRRAEDLLQACGPRLQRTLAEAEEAAGRLNRAAAGIEERLGQLVTVADAARDLATSLRQLRRGVRQASAVAVALGPAVAAGMRAFFSRGPEPAANPARADEPLQTDERSNSS